MTSTPSAPRLLKPEPLEKRRVLLLKGGWTAEREVSLESGASIKKALLNLGHDLEILDPRRDLEHVSNSILKSFKGQKPEVIVNALHGKDVEDGLIQGVLELVGIPYTFSGVLASALAMNKRVARELAAFHNIPIPKGRVLSFNDYAKEGYTSYPHVIKPPDEGSSVGVSFINTPEEFKKAINAWNFGTEVLVEDYVPGKELSVAVFGGTALGGVDIVFDAPIFSYKEKYRKGFATHIIPPEVPEEVLNRLYALSEKAHRIFGCRGITRSDFRYNPHAPYGEDIFFLETNTQPGMTPLSLVPDIAKHAGWSYEDVLTFLLKEALHASSNTQLCA